ncbi:signal peptidase II [Isoptericola croceus]|uniref:signal peptidase II n=1 Tax=Isoptericola croceus TaxID=3031406 RepID=UPI0023F83BC5|nr:signal peptidase II [Isoptericola croceus]
MSSTPAGADPASELPPDRPDDGAVSDVPATAAGPQVARRLGIWSLGLAALVLAIDQLTKWWALMALAPGVPVPLLGELLQLRLVFNPGAALSLATGYTWVLTIVVVAVVVVILAALRRLGSRGWALALGLLLGGALGNLVDRLVRDPGFARGHVVDMIDYAGFFVGNVADIAIVAAAALIVVLSFRGIGLDGRRHVADEKDAPSTSEPSGQDGRSEGTA